MRQKTSEAAGGKEKNHMKRRRGGIACILLTLTVQLFAMGGGVSVYGAAGMSGLANPGDSVGKTRADGENWTFTSPVKASYTVELFGPKAEGDHGGGGGYVTANIDLDEGETIKVYLGPGAPATDKARNGKKGNSGSGYGDAGVHKAAVMMGETILMTAGGGGSQGNPGEGDGSTKSNGKASCKSRSCPYNETGDLMHWAINGVGGEGGEGADGGKHTITTGGNGKAGSAEYWTIYSVMPYDHYRYLEGGTGGSGGDGGASYTNPVFCSSPTLIAGLNTGESKIIITMGEEILPPLDSKLIVDVKKEILAAIASIGGITASPADIVPEITVVEGKSFHRTVAAYADMNNGSAKGVTVENDDKENKTIHIFGTLNQTGDQEIVIDGRSFLFHVVKEPDSANVRVVFD